jgi:hypothetical protein
VHNLHPCALALCIGARARAKKNTAQKNTTPLKTLTAPFHSLNCPNDSHCVMPCKTHLLFIFFGQEQTKGATQKQQKQLSPPSNATRCKLGGTFVCAQRIHKP